MNRMQEISFNTSLIRGMRMIASYNKLIEQGRMSGGKLMLVHVIEAEEFIRRFFVDKQTERQLGFSAASSQHGSRTGRPVARGQFRTARYRIDRGSRHQIFLIV